ncbi:MAG: hypothetical protein PHH24_00705 [Candidatus Moranbacteria bacterium]|jgi:hypothetical protein|nr:hypothetical protein [Candidatus Moranbacteria bacterium]MDX9855780.1 hypothetical protein [Candidatus Moranbacteria bacterium]
MNSLKNTVTDVSQSENSISFFASTPQDFSKIDISINLEKKSDPISVSQINVKKSYKSFFYPEAELRESLGTDIQENLLVASEESYFIAGNRQKNPIDNPLTLTGLGYAFENRETGEIDLSEYEKEDLLNISSAHPEGTILHTDKDNYYLIENGFKKKINLSEYPYVKDFKNNISVQEGSLAIGEVCHPDQHPFFKRRYSCTISAEKLSRFSGKDYRFELSDIPKSVKIAKIDLEFKKTPNKSNLFLFLADTKNKIRARFTGEKL